MKSQGGKTKWKSGQSGNPRGRPKKGASLTDILTKQGELKDVTDGKEKIARKEALAKRLWALALAGDINAIKYIYDRVDGRPDQKHEVGVEVPGAEALITILHQAHEKRKKLQAKQLDVLPE